MIQAVDLVEWREVAVKVHQLNPQWNEQKRESYVKHAVRSLRLLSPGLPASRLVPIE